MKIADWYFDFISPFAYIGLARLGRFSEKLEIRYRPILFAGLLNHWGQKGPAEIPPKRTWTFRYCTWWAAQQGIAFRSPARDRCRQYAVRHSTHLRSVVDNGS